MDLETADLLFGLARAQLGTVQSGDAGLIGLAKSSGAHIIIVNTDRSEVSPVADIELLGKAGEIVPRILGRLEA